MKSMQNLRIETLKYGFFVHYVFNERNTITIRPDGSAPSDFEGFANQFDVEKFAKDMKSFEVDYIIFTAAHANQNFLFPCEAVKKWGLTSHFCTRDLIGDMIRAVKAQGIEVMLYTHPRDGHDFCAEDQVLTGWNENDPDDIYNPLMGKFDFGKWNDFINDCYAEIVDRYGKDIVGLYIDEGSPLGDSERVVDYKRLRETIKSRYGHIAMIQNYYGTVYTCDIGDKEYSYWGEFADSNGEKWPCYDMCVGTVMGGQFWAKEPRGTKAVRFSPEDMFRYTVLEAGANTQGGGVQWAAGPYPDGDWEDGVREAMQAVGRYVKEVRESICGTVPSTSFITKPGKTIETIEWGVATTSADHKTEYLHVLKHPASRQLVLQGPADGKKFTSGALLKSGKIVDIDVTAESIIITLPVGEPWDEVDTVITLTCSTD